MASHRSAPDRKAGRPTLFTKDRIEKLLNALKLGNYRVVAARYAGISDATFYQWMDRGKADRANGVASDWVKFLNDVEEAEAQAEAMLVADLRAQARTNPTATLGMLKVRFRDRWAEAPQRLEITGKDGGPVAISPVLAQVPDAVLEERIAKLEREIGEDEDPPRPRLVSGA